MTKSLRTKPNDPEILYRRGVAYYLSTSYKEALLDFKESLENDPFPGYEPDIYYHIGLSYANLEEFELSIPAYTKAIELCKTEPVYYHERAKSYVIVDEYQAAVDDFGVVIKMQPNNSHAYFGRGFAFKNLKEYTKSADDFEKAKELDPENPKLVVNYKKIHNIKFIKICEPGQEQI